jgi:hypothetical protein
MPLPTKHRSRVFPKGKSIALEFVEGLSEISRDMHKRAEYSVFLLAGQQLLYSKHSIFFVEEYDFGIEPFCLIIFEVTVAEDDNLVSHDALSRSGAVQADLSGAFLPGNRVGLKPLSVVEIADHHLFIRKYPGFFQYAFIDGNTPLVRKV